jgi:glycosyltransferase involved in cell wall biosynthesis
MIVTGESMENRTPRVSIGLPVYNGEKYLSQALDSILRQTYTDFELVISDNASSDKTKEICVAYSAKDKRIRYHRNAENLGVSKNYRLVFEMTKGEYFRWSAYDDVLAPELLERCVEVLDRHPNVVLCYPKTIVIDEQGNIVSTYEDNFNFRSPFPHIRFRDFLRVCEPSDCNAIFGLIRRSVLEKTPLIKDYHSTDKILLGELALLGEFYEVPERLFYRRFHPGISTRAYVTAQATARWFNPSARWAFPRLRRMLEFRNSLQRAPLTAYQRLYCYAHVVRFYLAGEKWQRLVQQILSNLRHLFLTHKGTLVVIITVISPMLEGL